MNLQLYQQVVLLRDCPGQGLPAGTVGWLLDIVNHPAGKPAAGVLEVFDDSGDSKVATVPVPDLAPWQANGDV